MKKKLLRICLIVLAITAVYLLVNRDSEAEVLRKKYATYLKNSPFNKTMDLTKKERKALGIPPNKYFEEEYLKEMDPNTGTTHPENYFRLQKELQAKRKGQRVPGDTSDNKWIERGPNNVGGRTRVLLFDPNDATNKRVFAGGVSGGLWVNNDITDANSSWIRVGIDENLSVSCITVDPNNSQIMYVGTGESYTYDQALGNGVWKTIDGGNSWTQVYSNFSNPDFKYRAYFINAIIAWNNPATSKTELFFGAAGAFYNGDQFPGQYALGLYKSVDDGTTWTWKTDIPTIPSIDAKSYGALYEPTDFEIGPDNTLWMATANNIYGNGGGTILKSTDGTNFTVVHTVSDGNRTELAISKQDPNKIYALYQGPSGAPKMEVTTDGFAELANTTTITLPNDADTDISAADFTRGQAGYDLMIEVDPTDDSKVYIGGIDLFKSINNGTTWIQLSHWYGGFSHQEVHADQHALAFNSTSRMVFGNDGGVYFSDDSGVTIAARNKDYNVTQFYTVGVGPIAAFSGDYFLAGAQDNGTQLFENAAGGITGTQDVSGGDGAYSFFDQDGTDKYFITNYVYNNGINLYDFTTQKTRKLSNDASGDSNGSFINEEALDSNLDILYSNYSSGSNYIIRKYSNIKSGTVTRQNLSNSFMDAKPTAMTVSPYTTNQSNLFVGLSNGKLLKVTKADSFLTTWKVISGAGFVGSVSDIEFGANENEILVTFHNYGVKNIWFTEDGGITWQEKEGDFPDIPVKTILMNPLNNDEVIIGTQLGIWKTGNFKDASPTWIQSYNGMSNVKVTDLDLRDDNTVFAATYGRGVFSGKFTAATASIDEVLADKKVFTMYPTVSDGNFTVFAKNTLGKSTLRIFDINGKQVYTQQLNFNNQSKQAVSVNLSSGVYMVNLIDKNNKKATGKIVIK